MSGTIFGAAGSYSGTLTALFNSIRVKCPGLTDEHMALELLEGMRTFFSESLAWRESGSITIAAPTVTIGLADWRTGAEVILPTQVNWNGAPLTALPIVSDVALSQVGSPTCYMFDQSKTITLAPQPNSVGGLVHIFVALQPSLVSPAVPDTQLSLFYDGILDTVLGRLYASPAKPFSNMALATMCMKKSRAWINKARDMAKRGFAGAESSWSFPYFANGSGGGLWGIGTGGSAGDAGIETVPASTLTAQQLLAIFQSLPTTLPSVPGVLWLNGGVPSIS